MKTRTSRILAMLLSLTVALALAGCPENGGDDPDTGGTVGDGDTSMTEEDGGGEDAGDEEDGGAEDTGADQKDGGAEDAGDDQDGGGEDAGVDGDTGDQMGDAGDEPDGDDDDNPGDTGTPMEICDNLDPTDQPIDDDGDGQANCMDSDCLGKMSAAEACFDYQEFPEIGRNESVMGVIGPSDKVDQNLDTDPTNDIERDSFLPKVTLPMMAPKMADFRKGDTVEFKVIVHNSGTLEPKFKLVGEMEGEGPGPDAGGGGGPDASGGPVENAIAEGSGDGSKPLVVTHTFNSDPSPGLRIIISDRRNPDQGTASDAPHGGANFTYTLEANIVNP